MRDSVRTRFVTASCALWLFFAATSCSLIPGLGEISEPGGADDAARPVDQPDAVAQMENPAQKAESPDRGAADAEDDSRGATDVYGGAFIEADEKWGDMILARVDGAAIRASDLYQTFFLENPVRTRNALQNEILYILAGKEARRLGVTVRAGAVDEVVKKTIDDHRQRCASALNAAVDLEKFVETQYGMTFAEYLLTVRRTAVFNLLLDRLVRYGEMSRRRLQVGVIVVKERLLAEEIRRKLDKGASFDVLAEKHSLDRSSSSGGILAPIPVDVNHPLYPLVEGVIGAKPGDLSAVEPTPYMTETVYRIVKLIADLEPSADEYGSIADRVEESLRNDPIDLAAIQYWQLNLRSRYKIELTAR